MRPNPTDAELRQIAEQVWAAYLDLDGTSPLVAVPAHRAAPDICASVSVSGAWHGHVVVTCSQVASRNAASALLGVEVEEVTEADVADALGELANIIGGNVKSLLPEPCSLSLPQVVAEGAASRYAEEIEICQLRASWLDEPVTVSVLEGTADRVGAATP